ncbi:hypothetical protein [[Phormidium] sp. LEGE 05292]|uniref:hypothetical protein n=1 Tax=[Phormidium] sp. LEGE 05292 TaxID=767427 RepID=UPI001D15973B|nr:hypothetical protein [Phormidium sp. LEGE 05292]
MGAVLFAIALTVLVRKHRSTFWWTLVGTVCLLIAFPIIYFWRIEPVNIIIEQANAETIPTNWQQLRNQWEYAHVTNLIFTLAGLSALLFSEIIEHFKYNGS